MASLIQTSKKLIKAINTKGYTLTYGSKEFLGNDGKIHNYGTVYIAKYNEARHRYDSVPIYSTPSTVRVVMYLRDFWFILNGMELPTDQELWNKIRKQLIAEGNFIYGKHRA